MKALRIDHTAIVVGNLDDAIQRYRQLLGLEPSHRQQVPEQGVEVAFLDVGATQLELITPLDETSGIGRYLARNGEGLHHVAFLVEDIRHELQTLADDGFELIDREPRHGAHGLVAFVHPRSMGGILVELVEQPRDDALQA
jgi:methylmalonyl-CoA/ethylmalonyl-CoA epimerase